MENQNTFKLTDSVTVRNGTRVYAAHNELISFFSALNGTLPLCGYITVGTDGSARTGNGLNAPVASKIAVLSEYNVDPSKGGLFAVYTADFNDDDLPALCEIKEAGLSVSAQGGTINRAVFPAAAKSSGTDITVRAELRLEFVSDKLSFTAGENALAKILLGIIPPSPHVYELAAGTDFHKTAVIPRSANNITQKIAVERQTDGNGWKFTADFTAEPYEIILLIDGAPVLRGFYITGAGVSSGLSATLRRNNSAEHRSAHVVGCFNVKVGGVTPEYFYLRPYVTRVTADCPDFIPFKLPKNAHFLSEPTGVYTGVVTDKEITVYGVVGGKCAALYSVPKSVNATADLCSDGSLFVADGKLTAYLYDGKRAEKKVPCDYVNVRQATAIYVNGIYKIAILGGTDFHLITMKNGEVTETSTLSGVPDDFTVDKHDRCFIDYWSVGGGIYESVGVLGNSANNVTRLKGYFTNSRYSVEAKRGRWMILVAKSNGTRSIMNFEGSRLISVGTNDVNLFGEYACVYNASGMLDKFVTYDGTSMDPKNLWADVSIERTDELTELNGYILAMYPDGKVKTFYPVEYGKIIHCPYATGTALTYDAVIANNPMSGGNRARTSVTLKFGEEENQ